MNTSAGSMRGENHRRVPVVLDFACLPRSDQSLHLRTDQPTGLLSLEVNRLSGWQRQMKSGFLGEELVNHSSSLCVTMPSVIIKKNHSTWRHLLKKEFEGRQGGNCRI